MSVDKYLIRIDFGPIGEMSDIDLEVGKETIQSIVQNMFPGCPVTLAMTGNDCLNTREILVEVNIVNFYSYTHGDCEKIVKALKDEQGVFILRVEALQEYSPPVLVEQQPTTSWLAIGTAIWYKNEGITFETQMPMEFLTTVLAYSEKYPDLLEMTRMIHKLLYRGISLFKNTDGGLLRAYRYGDPNEVVLSKK